MSDVRPARPVAVVSLDPLARAVRITLGAQFVVLVLVLVVLLHERTLTGRALDGTVAPNDALDVDDSVSTLLVVLLVVTVVTATMWIRWFYRARLNVEAWDPRFERRRPVWAIAGWLVPGLNLFLPFMIARDILDDTQRDSIVRWRSRPVLMMWWLAGLAYVALFVVARVRADRSDFARLYGAVNTEIVAILFGIAAVVLAWSVLGQITRAQANRAWDDLDAATGADAAEWRSN